CYIVLAPLVSTAEIFVATSASPHVGLDDWNHPLATSVSRIVPSSPVSALFPYTTLFRSVSVADSLPSTSRSLLGVKLTVRFVPLAALDRNDTLPITPKVASAASVPAPAAALTLTVRLFSSVLPALVNLTLRACAPPSSVT